MGDAVDQVRRHAAIVPRRAKVRPNDHCVDCRLEFKGGIAVPRQVVQFVQRRADGVASPTPQESSIGEFAGSATLIERLPQSWQTILKRDRSRVAVSSAFIMLKLINTRLRRPGRPCRGPSNGDDRPPNASVSKIGALRDVRALRCGALSMARTRRPCDAHKPLRREWSPRTQNREMRLFR
jgi:hypothetical protein